MNLSVARNIFLCSKLTNTSLWSGYSGNVLKGQRKGVFHFIFTPFINAEVFPRWRDIFFPYRRH
jgi:hypothetical protein